MNQANSSNNEQVKIDIILDRDRYNNLVSVCKKYKEQQGVELTPREYILMLIDSAISAWNIFPSVVARLAWSSASTIVSSEC